MAFALGLKTGKMLRNTGIVVNFKCDYIDKLGVTNIRWEQNAIKVLDTSRLLVKPFIYTLILIATAGLIVGYCFIRDDDGMIAFAVSISYALVLFLVMIPINKIEKYTSEKLFERESYYLTLKRLRDVTNSTIQKADKNDIDDLIKHIMSFQVFTGRTEGMIEQRLQGKNTPIYINEKGFTYSAHMQKLEIKTLKLHNNDGNKKELSKYAKKLCKYYKKFVNI